MNRDKEPYQGWKEIIPILLKSNIIILFIITIVLFPYKILFPSAFHNNFYFL